MRIAVLGGTGSTGRHVVNLALLAGHEVVVSARTPNKIERSDDRLHVNQGDAADEDHLVEAFTGCDAVVSCLGNGSFLDQRKETTFYSETAGAILSAMDRADVSRLVAITSSGVEHDPAAPWFYRKLIKPQLKTYADMAAMEGLIEDSGVEWTIVRPSWLRPGGTTGAYRTRDRRNPDGGWKIAVGDVAHFMVDEVATGTWLHRHPALAY